MIQPRPVSTTSGDPKPVPEASTLETPPHPAAGAETVGSPPVWPYPTEESPRRLRAALAAAAALHALLLMLPMPATQARVPDTEKEDYLAIASPLLKPPSPKPETVPVGPGEPVPIAEPVLTDPEPIRAVDVLPPVYDLPPPDSAIDIPDAPPPVDPDHRGPYVVGGPVSAPVRLEAPTPVYPELAVRLRRECTVLLRSVIDESGRVTEIEVEQGCPLGMTEAAVDAVERWRYRPATRKGLPVPVYMNLRVAFTLD